MLEMTYGEQIYRVENAYHAAAVDEHRQDYNVCL
jgi:hypothetical protein